MRLVSKKTGLSDVHQINMRGGGHDAVFVRRFGRDKWAFIAHQLAVTRAGAMF